MQQFCRSEVILTIGAGGFLFKTLLFGVLSDNVTGMSVDYI